jgi:hypothetical protein
MDKQLGVSYNDLEHDLIMHNNNLDVLSEMNKHKGSAQNTTRLAEITNQINNQGIREMDDDEFSVTSFKRI